MANCMFLVDVVVDGRPVFSGACPAESRADGVPVSCSFPKIARRKSGAEFLSAELRWNFQDAELELPSMENLLAAPPAGVAWDRAVCSVRVLDVPRLHALCHLRAGPRGASAFRAPPAGAERHAEAAGDRSLACKKGL